MEPSSPKRRLLIVGATGQQGGAAVRALADHPPPYDYEILALTRNANSTAAKSLATIPRVTILTGDLGHVDAIFESAGGRGSIWGVFAVQVPDLGNNAADSIEVKQGCALIDAAVAYGVRHFVQTSVDRGGPASDRNPTHIGHFITKHLIESHLRERTAQGNMTYTILRPVAFMDMLSPTYNGRVFASWWAAMGEKPLQLVATRDIGIFAAQALSMPDTDEYHNQAISLAGDELTFAQANQVMWQVLHRPVPQAYSLTGKLILWLIPELGHMVQWFIDVGFRADVDKCRQLNGQMTNLATWLKRDSRFTKED